jgi:uroporphyrin-III C-methyltransferase
VRSCEVLVFDRLVSDELVAEAPPEALLIGREALRQEQINQLLVRHGLRGVEVVRLKGGDPFVFGRGGEEALALAAAGVPFEVVPGVSALASVPAAAGIPVTHRGVAQQVTLVAGHAADGAEPDYAALARAPGTLVFFMSLARVHAIARGLVAHGRDAREPAAVIANGTLPEQETVTAPLGRIATAAAGLPSPALLVVGEVVAVGAQLAELAALQLAAA